MPKRKNQGQDLLNGNCLRAVGFLWGGNQELNNVYKTVMDPCPEGYMVASRQTWKSIQQDYGDGDFSISTKTQKDEISRLGYKNGENGQTIYQLFREGFYWPSGMHLENAKNVNYENICYIRNEYDLLEFNEINYDSIKYPFSQNAYSIRCEKVN